MPKAAVAALSVIGAICVVVSAAARGSIWAS
jgi:hypothetical protein